MRRRPGPYKEKTVKALKVVGDLLEHPVTDRDTPLLTVGVAITYALLEVAHQVGRVADNVPMWGPEEER
jgi:hypothetical protein